MPVAALKMDKAPVATDPSVTSASVTRDAGSINVDSETEEVTNNGGQRDRATERQRDTERERERERGREIDTHHRLVHRRGRASHPSCLALRVLSASEAESNL